MAQQTQPELLLKNAKVWVEELRSVNGTTTPAVFIQTEKGIQGINIGEKNYKKIQELLK